MNTSNKKQDTIRLNTKQWLMLSILTLSSFIVVLDFSSMFIPLPTIMGDLGGGLDKATWIIAAFTLTFGTFLYPAYILAGFYGERRLFLSGVTIFTVVSIACALAPAMGFLIGARIVLGIGAAMLEAGVFLLIKANFSNEKQSFAFKVQGVAFIAGGLLGTPLSGVITTGLSWPYIFWLNVLVGVVVLLLGLRIVPSSAPVHRPKKPHIISIVFSGLGLFLLFFATIEGAQFGWQSPVILASFSGAIILLLLFLITEWRSQKPSRRPGLINNKLFILGNFLRWASEFASMGVYFVISDFLQTQIGYSAVITGLLLLTVIGGGLLVSPATEQLAKYVDNRWLIFPGFLVVAAGTYWLAHVSLETEWLFFLAPLAIAGAGFVAQEDPTINGRDRNVSREQLDAVWHISYSIFLLGIGLGVSTVSAIWQSRILAYASNAEAVNKALLVCVAVSVLGAVFSLFFVSEKGGNSTNEHNNH